MNVPNLLSLLRLPLAAAFLLASSTTARVLIIAAAGASDYLDGWWARRHRATSTGAVLDPIMDKVFVVTALVAFARERTITPAALLVLTARDIAVTLGFGAVLALRVRMRLQARMPGKVVTALQIAAVLVLTLAPQAAPAVVLAVGVASVWAVADYGRTAVSALREHRALRASSSPR
jgi:CDP-diacylglycerol--glycerol-3-phosphate 3-phosphatidyltransferase